MMMKDILSIVGYQNKMAQIEWLYFTSLLTITQRLKLIKLPISFTNLLLNVCTIYSTQEYHNQKVGYPCKYKLAKSCQKRQFERTLNLMQLENKQLILWQVIFTVLYGVNLMLTKKY